MNQTQKQMSDMIHLLLAKGLTTYRIAKEVGVEWETVKRWSKGFLPADPKMIEKVQQLLEVNPESFRKRE